ncbi:translation initiation factor IF-2-like [Parus major]|uniref:translation initiation factor IF-2-like n=1 Tax=Parus major TaxID=9157 RepID=UPI001443C874|nr:translation initiation factor IF-2-like [Parus major]
MQPAPSAPPARSQYTSTRKKHSEDRRLSVATADSSASLTSGSSPARSVRRRAVAKKGHVQDETRPHDHPVLKGGEGWAEPTPGEPPAPERRRSRTRRSYDQAASGASERHQSPPPCSCRPALPREAAPWRRGEAAPWRRGEAAPWRRGEAAPWRRGEAAFPLRRDMAAEESRCLLLHAASYSYPRFWVCLCLGSSSMVADT